MSKITFQADKDRRDDAHVSCLQEETISLYTPLTSDSSIPVPIIKLAKQRASRVITLDNHIHGIYFLIISKYIQHTLQRCIPSEIYIFKGIVYLL